MTKMKPALLFAAITLVASANAFGTVFFPKTAQNPASTRLNRRQMSSEDESTMISSVNKKQIVYDEKTGRFFESNIDAEECIPDEEFCVVDKESGAMIRLTVEEKERIFLDALQVSRFGPEIVLAYFALSL